MATFHFDLVSPARLLLSEEVTQVDVPGVEGDFGVLAGHAPVVATLKPGVMTVYASGGTQRFVVFGGFAEVSPTGMTVLAEVATPAAEVDRRRSRPASANSRKAATSSRATRSTTAPARRSSTSGRSSACCRTAP